MRSWLYIRCRWEFDLGTPIYNRCQTQGWGSRKKTSPKIWWIQKVVVTLHPQLQRKGGRKCPIHDWRLVTTTADLSAYRASLGAYLIQASSKQKSIGEKKLSKYLVVSKTCRTFALTIHKKKRFALHTWRGLELGLLKSYSCGDYRSDLWYIS